jgi:hypothetical protein
MTEAEFLGYLDVLEGPDRSSGCRGEADDAVYGRLLTATVPSEVYDEAWRAFTNDPRVVAATEAWATCMQAKGYPGLRLPEEASARATESISGDAGRTAAQFELEIAAADVACAEVHLWDVWYEVGTPLVAMLEASADTG